MPFRAALLQPVMSILRGGHGLHSTTSRERVRGRGSHRWRIPRQDHALRLERTPPFPNLAYSYPPTSRIWLSVTRIVTSTYLTRWRVHSQLNLLRCVFLKPRSLKVGERRPRTEASSFVRKKIRKDDLSRGTFQTPPVSDRWHPENPRVRVVLPVPCPYFLRLIRARSVSRSVSCLDPI
ncbi:hypothetical protein EDB87DRAFT_543864 [Lactarius vividus]|nr:hypothetical protein EDB87DRAFT_543864 [Lactarius vividus]